MSECPMLPLTGIQCRTSPLLRLGWCVKTRRGRRFPCTGWTLQGGCAVPVISGSPPRVIAAPLGIPEGHVSTHVDIDHALMRLPFPTFLFFYMLPARHPTCCGCCGLPGKEVTFNRPLGDWGCIGLDAIVRIVTRNSRMTSQCCGPLSLVKLGLEERFSHDLGRD